MADYDKASGALFKNRKKQAEKQPDYTGNIEMDGDVVRDLMAQLNEGVKHPKADLSAWIRKSKSGMNFLSLNSSIYYERNGGHNKSSNNSNNQTSGLDDMDDEIPF
jgi:hypothetical protein|tara:strand:+ start:78 stop:395 length:318 start_codon:yes stop_codon:yes gene_type:complete